MIPNKEKELYLNIDRLDEVLTYNEYTGDLVSNKLLSSIEIPNKTDLKEIANAYMHN